MKANALLPHLLLLALLSCDSKNDKEVSSSKSKIEKAKLASLPTESQSLPQKKDTAKAVVASISVTPSYPDISPTLFIKTLWAHELTEGGPAGLDDEDEIYFLLGGKKSDGTSYSERLPTGLTWSLKKGGGPAKQSLAGAYPNQSPYPAWHGTLKNGESVELTILWMEEDKGSTGDRINTAAGIAQKTSSDDSVIGLIATIGQVAGSLISSNGDDFVGSFAVRITNEKGIVKTEWLAKEHCTDEGETADGKRFNVAGSGAVYFTTAAVQ